MVGLWFEREIKFVITLAAKTFVVIASATGQLTKQV